MSRLVSYAATFLLVASTLKLAKDREERMKKEKEQKQQ